MEEAVMQTVYGELRVIDAHIHFFSHQFFQTFLQRRGRQLLEQDPQRLISGWDGRSRHRTRWR
jgi:hypothetical protein